MWLSKRQIERAVGALRGKDVADFGCGYEATIMRRVLDEVRHRDAASTLSLAPDLRRAPKVRAIEGLLPELDGAGRRPPRWTWSCACR